MRQELKKKTDNQHRLVKKQSKKSPKEQVFDPKVEQGLQDVTKSMRCLHEVEDDVGVGDDDDCYANSPASAQRRGESKPS